MSKLSMQNKQDSNHQELVEYALSFLPLNYDPKQIDPWNVEQVCKEHKELYKKVSTQRLKEFIEELEEKEAEKKGIIRDLIKMEFEVSDTDYPNVIENNPEIKKQHRYLTWRCSTIAGFDEERYNHKCKMSKHAHIAHQEWEKKKQERERRIEAENERKRLQEIELREAEKKSLEEHQKLEKEKRRQVLEREIDLFREEAIKIVERRLLEGNT